MPELAVPVEMRRLSWQTQTRTGHKAQRNAVPDSMMRAPHHKRDMKHSNTGTTDHGRGPQLRR